MLFFLCSVEFTCGAIWPWTPVCRKFITDSISLLVLICSNYLFLHDSILVGYRFLETCPFILGCQIFWQLIVHSILQRLFAYFCSISYYFSSFISYFIWILSLFFLVSLARGFSVLFILSKNQILLLLILSIVV